MKLLLNKGHKYKCSQCGGLIPDGHRYWQKGGGTWVSRQHTNCLEYTTNNVVNITEFNPEYQQVVEQQ